MVKGKTSHRIVHDRGKIFTIVLQQEVTTILCCLTTFFEMGRACSIYGGEERYIQVFGVET
jgi:hypothetical protein